MGRRMINTGPRFTPLKNGDIAISHKVLLHTYQLDSKSPTLKFSTPINPGLSAFKWISKNASNYEFYSIESMVFEFETSVSTSMSGKFYMYFDSDAKDAPAEDVADFSNQSGVQSTILWDRQCRMSVPAAVMRRAPGQRLFIRTDETVPSGDITLYDAGTIHTLMNPTLPGAPDGLTVGELWVHYRFKFMVPNTTRPGPGAGAGEVAMTQFQTKQRTELVDGNTDGQVSDDPFVSSNPADADPVIDTLGLGKWNTLLEGVKILRDGVYALKVAMDVGTEDDAENPLNPSELQVNSILTFREDTNPSSSTGALFDTVTNSTALPGTNPGLQMNENWTESNGNWVVNLLAGNVIGFYNEYRGVIGKALLGKGASLAINWLAALSPALVASARAEHKQLETLEHYRARHDALYRKRIQGLRERKTAHPRVDTPRPSIPVDKDVHFDTAGRGYVIVRPQSSGCAEIREYLKK